jgi:hypothetical protein
VGEEVAPLRFGVKKLLVLFGGEGEVTVNLAAVKAEIKNAEKN